MSSTSEASFSQYLHQVVQNSNRTTLPLTDALLNWSPAVVLARKRGAGCPVSSPAKAQRAISASAMGTRLRRVRVGAPMRRNISTSQKRPTRTLHFVNSSLTIPCRLRYLKDFGKSRGCPPDGLASSPENQRAVFFAIFNRVSQRFFHSGRVPMSTYFPKAGEIVRKWYVVDADGQTLGRLASQVARILMGKENPQYTPFLDTGDHVIVINAEKIRTTGMKAEQKQYHHYTGYPGGLRTEDYKKRLVRKPEAVIESAVKRMLPKNKLAAHMLSKLNVYRGDKHPHQAQKPQDLKLEVRAYPARKAAVS